MPMFTWAKRGNLLALEKRLGHICQLIGGTMYPDGKPDTSGHFRLQVIMQVRLTPLEVDWTNKGKGGVL